MASLISDLGTVVTGVLGWVGEAVDTIVGEPFLLLGTGIMVLGAAAAIIGRLIARS